MSILVPEEQDNVIINSSLKKTYIQVDALPLISASNNLFLSHRHKELSSFKHKELSQRTYGELSSSINNIDWSKLFDHVIDCSINSSADSDIRTTATLTLELSYYEYSQFFQCNNIDISIVENNKKSINGNNDWFWFNMILSISFGYRDLTDDNSKIMWYKQGDFVVISSSYSQDEQKLTLTLNDKTVLLNGDRKGSIKASKFIAETHKVTDDSDKTIIEIVPTRFHDGSWELKTSCPIKSIKNIIAPYSNITKKSYRNFNTLSDYVDYSLSYAPDTNLTSLRDGVIAGKLPNGWTYLQPKYDNDIDGWKTVQPPVYDFEPNKSIIQFKYPMCYNGIYYLYIVEYYPTYTPNQIVDIIDTTLTECSEITDYQLDVIGSEYGTVKTKGLIADSIEEVVKCNENSGYIIKSTVNNIYDSKTKNYLDPLYTCLPYDINVDSDITVWSILTKLRDLYPNWQMYFDREGKFICDRVSAGLDDPCYFTVTDDIVLKKEVSKDLSGFHNVTNVFCPDIEPDFYCETPSVIGSATENFFYKYQDENGSHTIYIRRYKLNFTTSFQNTKEIEDYIAENDCITIGFGCNFDGFCGIPDNGSYSESIRPIFIDLEFTALDESSVCLQYIPMTKITSDNDTTYITPPNIFDRIIKSDEDSVMFKLTKTDIAPVRDTSSSGYEITSYINKSIVLEYIGKMSSVIATAKNDNPNDNYSIDVVGSFEQNLSGSDYEKIYTIDDAYARANYENWKSSRTVNTINLDIITVPWLEVNQKVEFEGEQYLINSISRSYKDDIDSILLSKFYPLYEDTLTKTTKSSTAPNRHSDLAKYRHIELSPYAHENIRQGGFR